MSPHRKDKPLETTEILKRTDVLQLDSQVLLVRCKVCKLERIFLLCQTGIFSNSPDKVEVILPRLQLRLFEDNLGISVGL